jgi:hypothetical protein
MNFKNNNNLKKKMKMEKANKIEFQKVFLKELLFLVI